MAKKLLALATMAAIAGPASAARLDFGGDDWDIRWDNTLKFNVMSRVARADKDVYTGRLAGQPWQLADDSTLSVDRSKMGLVSTRFDILSEFDAIYKGNFGVRVSASGWYDPMYKDSDHPSDRLLSWASPSVDPGEYSDETKDWHYLGAEILDAFVFANFNIGDIYANVRAGRHTIYWGNSLLGTGAVHGIAGSMTTIDFNKALSVPGSEAKELFLPSNKISTSWQLTQNLTLNAFYGFEFREYRLPETGSFFSFAEGLTEDTEFVTLAPAVPGSPTFPFRGGYNVKSNKDEDGDWGINFQYFVEPWLLETTFVYMNYVSKIPDGLVGTGFTRQDVNVKDETVTLGDMRWQYKDDVDLYGIAFAKEIAGISVGMDLVYRKNAPLPPELGSALFRYAGEADPAAAFAAGDSSNYGGAIGETWHVVINGLGLLNDNGFWEGGSWILEATFSGLDDCTDNCDFLSSNVHDNRVSTHIGGVFSPTWFQVFPGIDLSVPIAFGYGVDGDSAPIGFGGFEETGSASVGLRFDINQKIEAVARYNAFFGPATNGIGALLKDRDNVSFTVKATF